MDGNYFFVHVEISSKEKHHMLESHACPQRGYLRQTTRKLFEHGLDPEEFESLYKLRLRMEKEIGGKKNTAHCYMADVRYDDLI